MTCNTPNCIEYKFGVSEHISVISTISSTTYQKFDYVPLEGIRNNFFKLVYKS